jgi:hypothetical protein
MTASLTTSSFSDLFSIIFDTRKSVSSLYFWLLFGLLSTMVSCDLQDWIRSSPMFRHFIGIIAFFFLFTTINPDKLPIGLLWTKTIAMYGVFLLITKSKWYFTMPLILTLVLDQSIKIYSDDDPNSEKNQDMILIVREILNILMILLIITGFLFYAYQQSQHFGSSFSWTKLLFYSTCKTH